MNTNTIERSPKSVSSTSSKRTLSPFSNVSRLLLAIMCVSFTSVAAIPVAQAARVNGSYEIQSISGSFKYDGDNIDIPERILKRIVGTKHGEITISKRKLHIDKRATVDIVEEYSNRYHIDVEASVTGPAYVNFEKKGDAYYGRASSKIITRFEASIFGEDFSGALKTQVAAKVERKQLKIAIKFYGASEGSDFSGRIVIIANR